VDDVVDARQTLDGLGRKRPCVSEMTPILMVEAITPSATSSGRAQRIGWQASHDATISRHGMSADKELLCERCSRNRDLASKPESSSIGRRPGRSCRFISHALRTGDIHPVSYPEETDVPGSLSYDVLPVNRQRAIDSSSERSKPPAATV